MIRLKEIEAALANVVGWEQSYNPAAEIDDDLTISESGLTFQGAHPLVTLDNMAAVMPDDWGFQYPAWDADKLYAEGAKVSHSNTYWQAVAENIGSEPEEGSADWKPYNILSDYLRRLTRNAIHTTVNTFLQNKELARETKSLVERRTFFDGAARLQATIDNRHRIVGMEIVPVRAMGVTAKIERIGLQMTGGTGDITIYLFHSSQVEPVKTATLHYTNTAGCFQWFTLTDFFLPYIGNDTDAGGAWFLCYCQDNLPDGMEALSVAKDWSAEPCQTCLGGSIEGWKQLTKYLQVSPFAVKAPEGWAQQPEMFDIGRLAYTNTCNYGINAEITIGCDLTDFIIEQRAMFASVIQKQVAVGALRTLAMNPDVRVNRHQVNATRDQILYEVDGNPQGRTSGLAAELATAYRALALDTQRLDRVCLCENNHGVKYRTV
jgi:hypothetical protein